MASSLEKNSAAVINSNTVAVLLVQKLQVTSKEALNENLVLDSYHTVNSVCQNDHSVDYHSKISNNGSSSSNNAINSTSETLSISKRPSSSAPATATETSSGKRRKYLTTAKFKCMSVEKRLITLNEYYGKSNVIDMTKPSIIHKRFRRATEKLLANYDLVLNTRLLDEEYELIIATSACKSVEQLNHAVNHISPFMKVSELPFIKLAVQKLCNLIYMDLLTREHHEDWFRVNVYGDLFDFTFISKSNYTTKRSECHSSVIKHLKNLGLLPNDTKDVKLDFVFSHMNSKVGDTLFCEDKKNEKESCKDRRKADYVREKCLKYWSTLLCDPGHIHHLTAFSCQFNKLELRVKATKIINGITVHIILKQVSIPHDALDGVSIAEYLVTIISLVRMVAENYEKLKIMMDITKKDDIVFAKYQSQNLFKDSSSSSQSSKTESSQSSVAESNDPDEEERKTRISQNIQAALDKFNEESMKKYFDCTWDDLNTLSDDGCL